MTTVLPTIVEVGPRDGLQNEATSVPSEVKIAFIADLVRAGVTRIEATGFAHPRLVPQLADAEAVMAGVPRDAGVSYIGLVLNDRGLDRALDAGVDEVNIVLVATDTFSHRNQNMDVAAAVASFERVAARARGAGVAVSATIGAAFGCPFEGEVATDVVVDLARRIDAGGAQEIALADTIGVGVPADVRRLFGAVREVSELPLRAHFHNTRNTGYANAVAALEVGVVALDASAGGFGGCPFAPDATGNIATEDLVYLLERSGWQTGVDREAVSSTARSLARHLGTPVPGLVGRAGGFPTQSAS